MAGGALGGGKAGEQSGPSEPPHETIKRANREVHAIFVIMAYIVALKYGWESGFRGWGFVILQSGSS